MQKLTNRYLLIAAALFLVLSGYVVPAQDVTASAQAASETRPAMKGSRLPAVAGWFDQVVRYYGPKSGEYESRLEAARNQSLPGKRAEFAW